MIESPAPSSPRLLGLRRLGALLWQKDGMNVGKHTTGRNRHTTQQAIELFIILHGQSDVARDDTALLVVTGRIPRQLEDLRTEIFEDRCQIDWSSGAHARSVLALACIMKMELMKSENGKEHSTLSSIIFTKLTKVSTDTTDGKLQAGLGGGGLWQQDETRQTC